MTSITIDISQKTITYSGEICVREVVAVTLISAGDTDASGLHLRIFSPATLATLAQVDTFTKVGSDFLCSLSLDGEELADAFVGVPARNKLRLGLQVWNTATGNASLLINDFSHVMQNPYTTEVEAQTL